MPHLSEKMSSRLQYCFRLVFQGRARQGRVVVRRRLAHPSGERVCSLSVPLFKSRDER
jgi:hypothetical protein